MDWEIFTYGNGDFLRQVFNAIAMLFGSDNYLIAVKLSALLGFIAVLVRAAFDHNVLGSFRWFIAMIAFCWVVMVPKSTVIITDRVNMTDSAVVNHVPFGLAATAGLFSALGNYLTEMTETVFNLPNTLRYQDSGLLSAHRMYDALSNMTIEDARINANYSEFLATCVIFDGIGQRRFTWEQVVASNDLADFYSTRVAANVARFRYTDTSGTDQILPCRTGFTDYLLADISSNDSIDAILHSAITPLVSRFGDEAAAIRQFRADVNASFNYLLGFSNTVDDMVVQAALVNGLSGGLSRIAQETGATEFNATLVGRQQAQQMSMQGSLVSLAKDKLPLMHGVFESFLYAVFPLIMLLAIINPAQTMLNYAKVLLWINLWAPLFAILNFAVNTWDRSALTSLVVGGFNAGNMGNIAAYVSDASATAMLIGTVLPVIAWFLVSGAGGLLVGMAGGLMRGALPRSGRALGNEPSVRRSEGSLPAPLTTALQTSSSTLTNVARSGQSAYRYPSPREPNGFSQGEDAFHELQASPANLRQSSIAAMTNVAAMGATQGRINGRWLASRESGGQDSGDISADQNNAERAWAEQHLRDVDALSKAAAKELASLSSGPVLLLSSENRSRVPLPTVVAPDPVAALPAAPVAVQPALQAPVPLPPPVTPAAPANVDAAVGELLPRVRYGMMGNADVKRLQQLIGMDEQYQTGNFRDLTKAALQHWLEERGIYGPQQEINRAEVGQVNSSHTAMDILRRNDRAPLTIENGYAVATNAHFPVEAGGAIGRTDIVKSTGRHECVALLQAYGAPFATQWEVGEKLFPGINLPQNTMIASFERNEHTGQWSYRGHAALFDAESGGYAGEGLHVIQQFENGFPYENQRVVHRGIIPERPDGESRKLGDDASQYYVVKIR